MTNRMSITQTIVTVGAASSEVIGVNPDRKFLAFMAQGSQDVTVVPGKAAAVVNNGLILSVLPSSKVSSGVTFPEAVPTDAFQCIAAGAGSKVIVWEGM